MMENMYSLLETVKLYCTKQQNVASEVLSTELRCRASPGNPQMPPLPCESRSTRGLSLVSDPNCSLNDYSITHSLPITIIESQPLFVLPMIKNHRTDDLSFTISSADHIASHPTLLHLAQAEAALVVRCHNREKFDLSIARHYELGSRQIDESRSSLGSSSSPIRATGGGRRATGRARSRAPEIHETLERLHEAWLSYYPISCV
jgi:hypothetical protein